MGQIQVTPVRANDFIARWSEIEPMLKKAMPVNLGRFEAIDILHLLMAQPQSAQGWFVVDDEKLLAVMVTQIVQYPRRRCLSMFCLSGERMAEWLEDAYKLMVEYGRSIGADHFEVSGRKGWEKIFDIEPKAVVLIKEIAVEAPV